MQKIIYPSSVPNGGNLVFPIFKGKVIGGQVLMDINSTFLISGSPNLLGTFYVAPDFQYLRQFKMSLNQVDFTVTKQLAIFVETPGFMVDGTFAVLLDITQDSNDTIEFYSVDSNPGQQTFLVVEI